MDQRDGKQIQTIRLELLLQVFLLQRWLQRGRSKRTRAGFQLCVPLQWQNIVHTSLLARRLWTWIISTMCTNWILVDINSQTQKYPEHDIQKTQITTYGTRCELFSTCYLVIIRVDRKQVCVVLIIPLLLLSNVFLTRPFRPRFIVSEH